MGKDVGEGNGGKPADPPPRRSDESTIKHSERSGQYDVGPPIEPVSLDSVEPPPPPPPPPVEE